MKVETSLGGTRKGSSEADNVAALVLDPYTANKSSHAKMGLRLNIEDCRTDISKKFPVNKNEVVMLQIELIGVQEHHVHESVRQILH